MTSASAAAVELPTSQFTGASALEAALLLAHSVWACVEEFKGKSNFANEAIRLKTLADVDYFPLGDTSDTEATLRLLQLQQLILQACLAHSDEEFPPALALACDAMREIAAAAIAIHINQEGAIAHLLSAAFWIGGGLARARPDSSVEEIKAALQSKQGRKGGIAASNNSPAGKAKAEIEKEFNAYQGGKHPSGFDSNADFARKMCQKYPAATSPQVIQRWCTAWGKQRRQDNATSKPLASG